MGHISHFFGGVGGGVFNVRGRGLVWGRVRPHLDPEDHAQSRRCSWRTDPHFLQLLASGLGVLGFARLGFAWGLGFRA